MSELEIIRDTLAGYVVGLAGRDVRDNVSAGQCYSESFLRGWSQGVEHRMRTALAGKPVSLTALLALLGKEAA